MNIRLDLGCGSMNMRSKVAPFDALKFMSSSENTLANVAEYLKHYILWRCCSRTQSILDRSSCWWNKDVMVGSTGIW